MSSAEKVFTGKHLFIHWNSLQQLKEVLHVPLKHKDK